MLKTLLDLLYPRFCYGCHRFLGDSDNRYLCLGCWRKISLLRQGACQRCGMPMGSGIGHQGRCCSCNTTPFHFVGVRAAGKYSGLLRKSIHAFKFSRQAALRYPLAAMITWQLKRRPFSVWPDLVISVPISPKTRLARGYNQTDLLATLVAKNIGAPFLSRALTKIRETRPQSRLGKTERQKNLRGAFLARKCRELSGKTVLLIDDVFTTGSTANECAGALKKAGAKKVLVATVGRAVSS